MTRPLRFPPSPKDRIREAKRANDFYADMAGVPRLDYSKYNLDRKRAAPVHDLNVPSEHQSQVTVISWWRLNCARYDLPEFALFAIPNGGARDPITGSRLKAEGVRPGIPDLMLAVLRGDFAGLFIEMKKQGRGASESQETVAAYLKPAGYCWRLCQSADDAILAITTYLRREAPRNTSSDARMA